MRLPFDLYFPISQEFGGNPDWYKQFNVLFPDGLYHPMAGHSGIDFATPTGTIIKAPHGGKVIEASFDEKGYGWYVKIENDDEGSVLAHFQSLTIQLGYQLVEGDQIGISDNTGNSTGPHLHWGYYQKPRNRGNGYAGFIDQRPILESAGLLQPLITSTSVNQPVVTPQVPVQTVSTNTEEKVTVLKAYLDTVEKERASFWKERDEARGLLEAAEKELEIVKAQLVESQKQEPTIVQTTVVGDTVKQEQMQREINTTVSQLTDLQKRYTILEGDYTAYREKHPDVVIEPDPIQPQTNELTEKEASDIHKLLLDAEAMIKDLTKENIDLKKAYTSLTKIWNKYSQQDSNVGLVALKYMDLYQEVRDIVRNYKTLGLFGAFKKGLAILDKALPQKEQVVGNKVSLADEVIPVKSTSDYIFEQLGLINKS